MIKFGSRVDVYLPEGFQPLVSVGDRVKAGESAVAGKTA
jgi:phosphatidylserine decarboxylase